MTGTVDSNLEADVVVVGAGLAGGAAACILAASGYDVVLVDRRRHPQHKLCGEFVSSESIPLLDQLGVTAELRDAGAVNIDGVRFTERGGGECSARLTEPALGISRLRLDASIIDRARTLGVNVVEPWNVANIQGDTEAGFRVDIAAAAATVAESTGDAKARSPETSDNSSNEATIRARHVIGAWGRRSRLDRVLRPHIAVASPWVAFKGHYRGCAIGETIEMHSFDGGYCGLSHVEDGILNACWIMHKNRIPRTGGDVSEATVEAVFSENQFLRQRFEQMTAEWDRPLSVSQLRFRATSAFVGDIPLVGDAAGMIAPLCGDGMSMALMSGIFLGELMAQNLAGALTSSALHDRYAAAWASGFSRRMFLGRAGHQLLTRPLPARLGVTLGRHFPRTLRWVIEETRGFPATFSRRLPRPRVQCDP